MDELLNIFCNVADASFAIDGKQRIMFWNPAAERLLGIEVKDAIGQPCWQILKGKTPDGRPFCQHDCPVIHALKQNRSVEAFDLLISGPAQETILTNISTLFISPDLHCRAAIVHLQRRPEDHFQWPDPR